MSTYVVCYKCNSAKEEGEKCPNCRSNNYYISKGQLVGRCKSCNTINRLFSNNECKKCLEGKGLKECNSCGLILPCFLFYHKKGVCKKCLLKKKNNCSICGEVSSGELCKKCNSGLLLFKEDRRLLENAILLLKVRQLETKWP